MEMRMKRIRKGTGEKTGCFSDPVGLLFPRRCPVCQEAVEEKGARICDICRTRLPYIRGPVCMRCGKPLFSEEQIGRASCRERV